MKVVRGFQKLAVPFHHAVITLGNFDGVHLGHQQIIQRALAEAKSRGGECIAYTFRPHPQVALRPTGNVSLLTTYDEKLELLKAAGVDWIIEEPFNRQFSNFEPQTFFKEVLVGHLHAEVIVVGYDFAFGHERHGHLELLRSLCDQSGVRLIIVEPQKIHGEVVSSTKIRHFLMAGKIPEANRLLGRPFSYQGVVIRGEGRGRQLGFPTANLKLENKLVLPYGVYATWAHWNGKKIPSVTNVGVRPTFVAQTGEDFTELPAWVETHLLDTTVDLYGSQLRVDFLARLREEKKFSSKDELVKQIHLDIQQARQCLANV